MKMIQIFKTLPVFLAIVFLLTTNGLDVEKRLHEIIEQAFRNRDFNNDGIVEDTEIRKYYELHPEQASKEKLDNMEKNLGHVTRFTLKEYSNLVRRWLAENQSIHRLIEEIYGQETKEMLDAKVRNATRDL